LIGSSIPERGVQLKLT